MSHDDDYLDLDSPENIGVFDELPFWSAPFGIRLFEQIHLKKNIRALDIGFGAGFPLDRTGHATWQIMHGIWH